MAEEGVCVGELELEGPPAVAEALEVDNMVTPPWLSATCTHSGGSIRCRVEVGGCGDPKRILSLRNTLIDILLCYRAASEALKAAGGLG
jgi:hypothetical protein